MIRLTGVSLKIGSFEVRSLNLEIERGEYFVILGPTGSGKTKLLEIIAGLQSPSSGEIWIGGRNVTALPPERRHIGFMYQDYLLFPQLLVRRNIAFGLRGTASQEARARITKLSALLKIDHLLDRPVTGLSGGEQQRIALARALAPRPDVLLLDEPLSALDPQNRRALQRELRTLHEELAITTLHVTHDFEEALVLADRLAILHEGAILQVGPPEVVFRRPNSTFVANFVGAENLFRGEIIRDDKDEPLSEGPFAATFRSGPLTLSIIGDHLGAACVAIRPEDVTISREIQHSSALNNLHGRVLNIERRGPLVRLTVDVGVPFVAVTTQQSFESLQLEVGTKAYLSFKASAIHVF